MNPGDDSKAVVLLSGGLDSTTVLALAQQRGFACYALSIDYQQRHRGEIKAAKRIAANAKVVQHKVFVMDLSVFGGSALTDSTLEVPTGPTQGIPLTYVPARNTIFLSLALAWAEVLNAHDIFIGVNAIDYSGYPDCRPEYIQAFAKMAQLATRQSVEGQAVHIRTPLIDMRKTQIIALGQTLGVDYSLTVSCYALAANNAACGQCAACKIRRQGFQGAGITDPTLYQV